MTVKLPSNLLEHMVLYVLESGPSYGYEVTSRIEEFSGGNWSPSYGTVYPLMQRMSEQNLIKKLSEEEAEDRDLEIGDRNYFEITDEGVRKLEEVEENKSEYEEEFRQLILGYVNIYRMAYPENLEELKMEVEEVETAEDTG